MAFETFEACRLLCLPCAGGSATVYARWAQAAPSWLAVRPLELPGRGTRHHEPLQYDPHLLADQLSDECLSQHIQRTGPATRFALFGHSLGGLLAFEIAHRLHARGCSPVALFVAASRPPATRDDSRYAALRDDAEVLAEMRTLGGTPEALLAEPELMAMVLPVIKADFQLCGHYRREPRAALPVPIHALAGKRDTFAPEVLDDWRCETRDAYTRTDFDGDHFFVRDDPAHLLAVIANRLAPAMHAPRAVAAAR